MDNIIIIEATEHMKDSIRFAYISEELIAQTFATRSTFNQTGNINNLHSSGYYAARIAQFDQLGETVIGHCYDTYVWLYRAEREIS
jgi:hypothetical protein